MNVELMLAIFFYCLFIYTYLGYPVILLFQKKIEGYFFERRRNDDSLVISRSFPDVTLIMTMHNAERLVWQKVKNIVELQYPGKLTFAFVLDGCSDNTEVEIKKAVKKYQLENAAIFPQKERVGKEQAIKNALSHIPDRVLVFSDADALMQEDAISKLVLKLQEPKVGVACGKEVHSHTAKNEGAGEGQGFFYRYENAVKQNQEALHRSLCYVQGGIFAMKREHYPSNIPPGATQDGMIAFQTIENGERVAFVEDALSFETYDVTNQHDYERRKRTISRAFYAILVCKRVLNPFKYGMFSIDLFSSRVLRWLSLYIVGLGFVFSVVGFNGSILSYLLLFVPLIFVLLSFFGYVAEKKKRRIKLLYVFYYFLYIHMAAAIAVFKVIKGDRTTMWKPTVS
jgi:cellulose synthase/poly-beta-1,6-N-acetylglucosamine synthase-like glycosyltransferase